MAFLMVFVKSFLSWRCSFSLVLDPQEILGGLVELHCSGVDAQLRAIAPAAPRPQQRFGCQG